MLTRGTTLFLASLLVLFGGSLWAGYAVHGRSARSAQYEQSGWCCMMKERTCVVADSLDACQAQGGATFDWDRTACDTACHPPVRRGEKKKKPAPGTRVSSPASP